MTRAADNRTADFFEQGSEANHLALERLSEILKDLGFNVRKKARSESTLRVYLKRQNEYPLLNPRFSVASSKGRLEITVLSKGQNPAVDSKLASHQSSLFSFSAHEKESQGLRYHGVVVIPLTVPEGGTSIEATLSQLTEPLVELRKLLVS